MKARTIIAWVIQVVLAVGFIMSGGQKLLHLPDTVAMFGKLGLPGWFAYLIGGAELLGGLGLLVPRLVRPAALGLVVVMLGAAFMHTTRIPGGLLPNGLPALGFLVLLLVLLWLRRPVPAVAA